MNSPSHLLLAPLVLFGLSLSPEALQGGGGGQDPGVGGTYSGPGDTVPANPGAQPDGTPPPPIGGPGDAGGGFGGAPTGGPGTVGPGPKAPPPGAIPIPPDEPSTPDAQPPVADTSSWQLWWHYNRWDHLPVGRTAELLAATGTGDFFLGRGQVSQQPIALRASATEVTDLVRPALLEVLREGGRQELVVFSLHALAKLRDHPLEGDWNFDAAARYYLKDGSQEVVEGALLSLGIRGDRSWTTQLVSVLHDTEAGRDLLARSRVGPRLRAFAAYSLAMLAQRETNEIYRLELHRKLVTALPDERPEVQSAVLAAIGNCAMPWKEADKFGTSSTGPVTLGDQIQIVAEFLADGQQASLARSQAPYALVLLARTAPEHLRVIAVEALLGQIGPHAKAPTEVRNGAVVALGQLGLSHGEPLDVRVRENLERVVTGAGADRLTRYLAMISLAQVGNRPGTGEEPLAGLEPTRKFLLRQLERNRGMHLAWSALALGVLEEPGHSRGEMPSVETADALRGALRTSRNGDVVGAVAVALGMLRDAEASEPLLEQVHESGSQVLRGYAALALGMIGANRALEPLRQLLRDSSNRPGSLQRVAIGLSLLGDAQAGSVLSQMLIGASSPDVQASIAAALGWVKDPRPLPQLTERLLKDPNDLSRSWVAVAVGRITDPADLPWNAHFTVSSNYDVPLSTMRDIEARQGLFDYP